MKRGELFGAWLASRRLAAAGGLFCVLMGLLLFWLYDLPWEAAIYLLLLCLVCASLLSLVSFARFCRAHRTLEIMEEGILVDSGNLPEPATLLEADYDRLVRRLIGRSGNSGPRPTEPWQI